MGAEIASKSLINLRYHPAVPRKLCTSLTDFGSFIFRIASTFSGSVFKTPPPMINPRNFNYWKQNVDFFSPIVKLAIFKHSEISFNSRKCSENVLDIINKSSR